MFSLISALLFNDLKKRIVNGFKRTFNGFKRFGYPLKTDCWKCLTVGQSPKTDCMKH